MSQATLVGEISLQDLFKNNIKDKLIGKVDLQKLIYLIIRGGWPQSIGMAEEEALELTQSYINDILNFDISNIDGMSRDINKMRMILRELARNESTIVNNNRIIKDVNKDNDIVSKNTVLEYIDILEKLHLIENQIAYSVNLRSSSRVGKSAKRHFTDPSLVCGILGLTTESLLNDVNFLGFLFESLCERDLKIYIESYNGNLYHFRDNTTGLEIDSIVEMPNGDYGAIEIKLGTDKIEEAAENLLKFNNSVEKKPKFLCIISGLHEAIIRRPDGIYVIPITALKN